QRPGDRAPGEPEQGARRTARHRPCRTDACRPAGRQPRLLSGRKAMLFLVIERYRNQEVRAVYGRARAHGRMLPDGLRYLGSWVEPSFARCFQLMECDDLQPMQRWIAA